MDAIEIAETMLDEIARRSTECASKAAEASKRMDNAGADDRPHLSAEIDRQNHAAHQLRLAMSACQKILDDAEDELASA